MATYQHVIVGVILFFACLIIGYRVASKIGD